MKKIILVTIGDINGIGIELLIKIWESKKNNNFILITNKKVLYKYLLNNKKLIKLNEINNDISQIKNLNFNKYLNIFDIQGNNNTDNAYNSIIRSYELLRKYNFFLGVVNLPVNKDNIIKKIDKNFIGQTELYTKLSKKKLANMVFVYKNLIFVTLTTHISLKKVNNKLMLKDYIFDKIKSLNNTLINDFNLQKPNIAISGINPHAGENNTIGKEESLYIVPALKKLIRNKVNIKGPYSADSLISNKNLKLFNCFVFNYHDQALIPFKILSKNNGINFTSGLNIIRVSPDHGTAYDIVGKNIAKINGIINCFKFVKKIDRNRKNIAKS